MEDIGLFGPMEVSQPMELRKELADEAGKLSFRFSIICLGKFVSCFASVISLYRQERFRVRL